MNNRQTRVIMIPVRVETYTDNDGKTRVGRLEHPTMTTVEKWLELDPRMQEDRACRAPVITVSRDGDVLLGRMTTMGLFYTANLAVDCGGEEGLVTLKDREDRTTPLRDLNEVVDLVHRRAMKRRA